MKNDELKSTLAAIAEQAAPSAEINLWPKLQRHLATTSESRLNPGDASMKITFRRTALIVLAVVVGLALLSATPQGQAFAQTIFRFFSPAESESYPSPQKPIAFHTPTPVPTFVLTLKVLAPPHNTADSVSPIPTSRTASELLKNCKDPSARLGYACQIALAESQAGFDALEFPAAPNAMTFTDAQSDAARQTITINYTAIQGGTYLILTQGLGTKPIKKSDEVPANAIEAVKIGRDDGEFVQGEYEYTDASGTSIQWNAEPGELRLVWAEGNRWFSLTKLGNVEVMEYMDKKFLLAMAANLVDNPQPQSDSSYQKSLPEAEAAAGFHLLVPGVLPKGFEFSYAHYETASRTATLFYHPKGQPAGVGQLVILETALDQNNHEMFSCKQCPTGTVEKIQLNGATAYYSQGSLDNGSAAKHADPSDLHLTWSTSTLLIVLNYSSTEWYGGQLTKETLVQIAESMK